MALEVWGWTVEEVHERLVAHLMKSSYHGLSGPDACAMSEASTVLEKDCDPAWKRARKSPEPPTQPPPLRALGAAMQQQPAEQLPSDLSIVGENISVRRVDFQAIVDSLNRASLAVRHAQRLAGAANRAFADEAANLDNIKSTLECSLASTDIV